MQKKTVGEAKDGTGNSLCCSIYLCINITYCIQDSFHQKYEAL